MKILNNKIFISAIVIIIGGLILFTGNKKPSEIKDVADSGIKEKINFKEAVGQKIHRQA